MDGFQVLVDLLGPFLQKDIAYLFLVTLNTEGTDSVIV